MLTPLWLLGNGFFVWDFRPGYRVAAEMKFIPSPLKEADMSMDRESDRASVTVIAESEATGKVKEIYQEIRETLGIDFVPNMYMALAANPDYLEMTWKKVQAVMGEEGKLGRRTKDIVALTVSIMSGCEYCVRVYNQAVKHGGLDDGALLELYEVIDLYSGLNRLNIGLQTKADEKPWHGCGGGRRPGGTQEEAR